MKDEWTLLAYYNTVEVIFFKTLGHPAESLAELGWNLLEAECDGAPREPSESYVAFIIVPPKELPDIRRLLPK